MNAPRRPPFRPSLEHLLLLVVLSLFAAGAIGVAVSTRSTTPKQQTAWTSLLPNIGLPLLNGLLPR